MITFTHKGNFSKTTNFLKSMSSRNYIQHLDKYAKKGVEALRIATPKDSGLTAASWGYEIKQDKSGVSIIWTNNSQNDGVLVAIILQYGHGTGTGGYVKGQDYINPAIRPIFDEIADSVWKEVTGR